MALDRNRLVNEIVAAMQRQMPDGEHVTDEARQFASDLAAAVDTYVHGGDVTNVRVRDLDDRILDQSGHGRIT